MGLPRLPKTTLSLWNWRCGKFKILVIFTETISHWNCHFVDSQWSPLPLFMSLSVVYISHLCVKNFWRRDGRVVNSLHPCTLCKATAQNTYIFTQNNSPPYAFALAPHITILLFPILLFWPHTEKLLLWENCCVSSRVALNFRKVMFAFKPVEIFWLKDMKGTYMCFSN